MTVLRRAVEDPVQPVDQDIDTLLEGDVGDVVVAWGFVGREASNGTTYLVTGDSADLVVVASVLINWRKTEVVRGWREELVKLSGHGIPRRDDSRTRHGCGSGMPLGLPAHPGGSREPSA